MVFNKNPLRAQDELIPYSVDLEDRVEEGFDDVLDKMFPIGTIYESTSSTNPGTFRPGTWELYGQGRVTVGLDTTQTEFNTIDKTGGAKTHKLSVDEMPTHNHTQSGDAESVRIPNFSFGTGGDRISVTSGHGYTIGRITDNGGDKPHNNLQPYITVYRFRRTA